MGTEMEVKRTEFERKTAVMKRGGGGLKKCENGERRDKKELS